MEKKRKYLIIIWHIFFVSLTVFLAWSYVKNSEKKQKEESTKTTEVRQSGYQFINPLIECEIEGDAALKKYIPFEKETKKIIQEEIIDKNKDISFSVYFRNLNNGPWFGINEMEKFSPASLLKVPIMIAYFKEIEENHGLGEKQIVYRRKVNELFDQSIVSGKVMEDGKAYSVEDLLFRMIVNSDNEAMDLLLENIPEEKVNQVHRDLGVVLPDAMNTENFISVKDYASFFRILYNAAYLDNEMSEKALNLLSQVEYRGGIVAGLREDIPVAHKFGERSIKENGANKKQLHDCGIVYYAEYPYLLCVMTRGDDFQKLSSTISDVSKVVFENVSDSFSKNKK